MPRLEASTNWTRIGYWSNYKQYIAGTIFWNTSMPYYTCLIRLSGKLWGLSRVVYFNILRVELQLLRNQRGIQLVAFLAFSNSQSETKLIFVTFRNSQRKNRRNLFVTFRDSHNENPTNLLRVFWYIVTVKIRLIFLAFSNSRSENPKNFLCDLQQQSKWEPN